MNFRARTAVLAALFFSFLVVNSVDTAAKSVVSARFVVGKAFYTEIPNGVDGQILRVIMRFDGSRFNIETAYGRERDATRVPLSQIRSSKISILKEIKSDYPSEVGYGSSAPTYSISIDLQNGEVISEKGKAYLVDVGFLCGARVRYAVCERTERFVTDNLGLPKSFAGQIFSMPVITAAVLAKGDEGLRKGASKSGTAGQGGDLKPIASGTGFFVNRNGYVVTNEHVIAGCDKIQIKSGEESKDAEIIVSDQSTDIAILKSEFSSTKYFKLNDRDGDLLEDVYVSGFPLGEILGNKLKVTKGIISSLEGIGGTEDHLQIDAALQSGNSGGPIFYQSGQVVGIAVAKLDVRSVLRAVGSLPENTNFGIKISNLKSLLKKEKVQYEIGSGGSLSGRQLGKLVSAATVYISCLGTARTARARRSR